METTQAHFHSDGHVVLTGYGTGPLTLADGTTYDATHPVVEVASEDHAAEMAHLIGLQVEQLDLHPAHDAKGRPDHLGRKRVPFVYARPKRWARYAPHADNNLKG